jgi:hypothetical protein
VTFPESNLGVLKNPSALGFFNGTFNVTPRFPAEIFGVETVARWLFVSGTLFQRLFQQSQYLKREALEGA